jgi:hydroxylamine reductase
MFCYQCEQTSKGNGCDKVGICGKEPEVADLQDLLIHSIKGMSMYVHRATQKGAKRDPELDQLVIDALFTTVTNVNFDAERIGAMITKTVELTKRARSLYEEACKAAGETPEKLACPAADDPPTDVAGMVAAGAKVGIQKRTVKRGPDATGLEELVLYGLKGLAAYADHARILGKQSDEVDAFCHEALSFLMGDPSVEELTAMALKVGEVNITVMGMLDEAHTSTYGHPVPTPVRTTAVKGKAILVSGHDLKDLHALLEQTKGKGINIYTHSEMLPSHGYPELKKYDHLVGNYGGAWQDQRKEFDAFPGAILMTTNCIQNPKETYSDRLFTAGLVAWPGVKHIEDQNYQPVIDAALAAPGFTEDEAEHTILTGFGHNAVMGVADKVIEAVKSGAIKHFFLIGGCDGAKSGRNYYTELAESVPKDAVILTLACGKYRFNKLDFGDIGGIPRLLDIGQCNDAYSAVQIAIALAKAFDTDVNGLPLSIVLSWFEQKAVVVLLSLLHLGIRDIRLGPTLPAFVTPPVLNVLVENFNIMPTTTADADLKAILN